MAETVREAVLGHYREQPERLYVRCLMPDGTSAPVSYRVLVERGSRFAADLLASAFVWAAGPPHGRRDF